MKDSEFIELLNLYIDHEISADDVSRLESEVLSHGGRRRIYQQYCRMHRACGVLATQFREGAPEAAVIFRPRRSVWVGAAYATGLMAAAAFAVVVGVRRHDTGVSAASPTLAQAARVSPSVAEAVRPSSPSAPAVEVAQATAPVDPVVGQLQPVVNLRDLNLLDSARNVRFSPGSAATVSLAAAQQAQMNAMFAWMKQVQVQPVQRPPLQAFGAAPVMLTPDDTRSGVSPYGDAQVEKAAFRFER